MTAHNIQGFSPFPISFRLPIDIIWKWHTARGRAQIHNESNFLRQFELLYSFDRMVTFI